jgi:hypothetical protein
LTREIQLRLMEVHRDDPARSADPRSLYRCHPDPATTDYENRVGRRYGCPVDYGAHTGADAASEQARYTWFDLIVDHGECRVSDDKGFGVCADAGEGADW